MTITSSDFFIRPGAADLFEPVESEELDRDRLARLIERSDPDVNDIEVALALMDLVRDDLQTSGTGGTCSLSDPDMRLAVRALQRTLLRAGHEVKLPFRDHAGWKVWLIGNGAHNMVQGPRSLLGRLFDEPYAALMAAQDCALDAILIETVSPHDQLGWPEIDTEIGELRRHFRAATTPQDYRSVGNDCVHITEALSKKIYDHARHSPDADEEEPPGQKTKLRIERYVEARLRGPENLELRKYARSAIELAQAVKHSGTPTKTEAGIVADAVISLANMLRKLDEQA